MWRGDRSNETPNDHDIPNHSEISTQKGCEDNFYYVENPVRTKPLTLQPKTIITIDDDDDDDEDTCNTELILKTTVVTSQEAIVRTKEPARDVITADALACADKRPLPPSSLCPPATKKIVVSKEGPESHEKIIDVEKSSENKEAKPEVKLRPLKSFWGPFTG